jgi:hypothetical protein
MFLPGGRGPVNGTHTIGSNVRRKIVEDPVKWIYLAFFWPTVVVGGIYVKQTDKKPPGGQPLQQEFSYSITILYLNSVARSIDR